MASAPLLITARSSALRSLGSMAAFLPSESDDFDTASDPDCATEPLLGVTTPLPALFLARCLATRWRVDSRLMARVTSSLCFAAFSTIQPFGTRSILRPSCSWSGACVSGLSRHSIAFAASSRLTRARPATLPTVDKATNPSSSMTAMKVIQTRRVESGSSHIEESTIFVKSLLYMAWRYSNTDLLPYARLRAASVHTTVPVRRDGPAG